MNADLPRRPREDFSRSTLRTTRGPTTLRRSLGLARRCGFVDIHSEALPRPPLHFFDGAPRERRERVKLLSDSEPCSSLMGWQARLRAWDARRLVAW